MTQKLKIDRMFACISTDPDGHEGVCGASLPNLGFTALVGADMARVDSLRPIARAIATASGQRIDLVEFSQRRQLEIIAAGDNQ